MALFSKDKCWTAGIAQVVECLAIMCEVLSSIPSTGKEREGERDGYSVEIKESIKDRYSTHTNKTRKLS
jgi:hypothetical protein